ncbi:hypothetical protein DXV75_06995 [Alteromonas aestuariivivens]|uniref:Glycosyltransferase 2-like prokaryotic type domain-containing protein n=1 Tax=Alteromonas aestuariivivens TaxID=1938339 RepID=A0A3D8M9N0_9ALTE|nr:glycosyltransferase [Alteromonas aestuariivivens]RDV26727.1 hypothetical protein DXV75_06995 [Alteromonas aestuariivivens]
MENQFSIVTIVHKRTQALSRLIREIEKSRLLPLEVIVVWMGSPCSESLLTSPHFTIKHKFVANEHLPVSRARNKGFDCCSATRIIYLEVDCQIPSHLFDELLNKLTVGQVVCPNVHYLASTKECLPEQELQHTPKLVPGHATAPTDTPVSFTYFRTMAFAIHKRDYHTIGGFDEEFSGIGVGDIDFAMRCSQSGLTLIKTASVVLYPDAGKLNPAILHLCDIVNNAARFKQKWGNYPMESWLRELVTAGLINDDYPHTGLRVKRMPTQQELAACQPEE